MPALAFQLNAPHGLFVCAMQADNVIAVLQQNMPADGLFPTQISTTTGKPVNNIVTFGGTGDSYFEYLVKAWIQVRWLSITHRCLACRASAPHMLSRYADPSYNASPARGLSSLVLQTVDTHIPAKRASCGRWCFTVVLALAWQGGKNENMYLSMYDTAMDGMEQKLLKRTKPSNLLMLSDWNGRTSTLKMDHLACFTPAMLALGALHR